jgi:hypothetical protein
MSATTFDLEVDIIPMTDPTQDRAAASADDAREAGPCTFSVPETCPVGLNRCVPCC